MARTGIVTHSPAWRALAEHYQKMKDVHLRTLFAEDAGRGDRFTVEA
ncbi:hypothetical protein GW813_09430, partial [bacterium]|nr:hypothetical protein [bacterium]